MKAEAREISLSLDHVHIEVADRDAAVRWFRNVLGLAPDPEFSDWSQDPMGPLLLRHPEGSGRLALFQRPTRRPTRDNTIAMSTDAETFVSYVRSLEMADIRDGDGDPVGFGTVVDHTIARSIYFMGPDENRFEITSYEYQKLGALLLSE